MAFKNQNTVVTEQSLCLHSHKFYNSFHYLGSDWQFTLHSDLNATWKVFKSCKKDKWDWTLGDAVNTFQYNMKMIRVNLLNQHIYWLLAALLKEPKKNQKKFRPSESVCKI